MNYTKNYHLPQWEEEDRIQMQDFNQMCSDIDQGLSGNAEAARAAQEEARDKGYLIGSYAGNGADQYDSGQHISIGFRPRFVIITRGWISNSGPGDFFLAVGQPQGEKQSWVYELRDDGFVVKNYSGGILSLNKTGLTYDYIAFK